MNVKLRPAAAGLCLPLLMMAGCGLVAAPEPPSLKLPQPVSDLTAQRTGNEVALHWTMPKRTTDKVLLIGRQTARICRGSGPEPCTTVAKVGFAPEASASFVDHLPAALVSGSSRPLVYTVELFNLSGRSAGASNEAVTAAGTAPPQVEELRGQAHPDGVVLSWAPTGAEETIRIHRLLDEKVGQRKTGIPAEQTLEFTGKDEGRVLDKDAVLDHTYTYTVQRVEKMTLRGQPVEVAGLASKPVRINARDIFPPATPIGLQAVADAEARAIDLSWQPDSEVDLAGYRIYRREAGVGVQPERVSDAVNPAPSFHDTSAQPGHAYEYSVSAVDQDGNESPRSAEVEELLPQQ